MKLRRGHLETSTDVDILPWVLRGRLHRGKTWWGNKELDLALEGGVIYTLGVIKLADKYT